VYDAWLADPAAVAPPGGETAVQVARRALAGLRKIEKAFEKAGKPVLGVAHKATLRILGASLTEAPVRLYRRRWPQDECALNLVELRKDKEPFLRLWNDTAHLGPDPGATTRGGK
jgi:probable phosphoglycerate mutase